MKFKDCLYKDVCKNTCKNACIRYNEMNYLLKTSNIPPAKQKINTLTPDDSDISAFEELAKIRDNIIDFASGKNNLYIYSSTCGNGKTTWAIKLMLQYFNECWSGNGFVKRGIFINVPAFLSQCKSTISNPDKDFDELREDLISVDLVIFDDIAATKLSEYDYNLLLTYIDKRVVNEKIIIYTGNLVPEKLPYYLGSRLASRVCGENTIKIMFNGGDNR